MCEKLIVTNFYANDIHTADACAEQTPFCWDITVSVAREKNLVTRTFSTPQIRSSQVSPAWSLSFLRWEEKTKILMWVVFCFLFSKHEEVFEFVLGRHQTCDILPHFQLHHQSFTFKFRQFLLFRRSGIKSPDNIWNLSPKVRFVRGFSNHVHFNVLITDTQIAKEKKRIKRAHNLLRGVSHSHVLTAFSSLFWGEWILKLYHPWRWCSVTKMSLTHL